jgi:FHS family L-fucose permease-like MFS transporter
VFGLPAAAVLARLGPSRTVLAALGVMIGGCLIVQVASAVQAYWIVLVALFTLAAGITLLQVTANPLAAALGDPDKSSFRLVLAQAFNSLGVVLGVHLGAKVMLSGSIFQGGKAIITDQASRVEGLAAVNHAFILIAIFLVVLGALIFVMRRTIEGAVPQADRDEAAASASIGAALRDRWALAGGVAIFLYVGSEVSIGSLMTLYLNRPDVLGLSLAAAGGYLANYYWGGALVGRFIGAGLLRVMPAPLLLTIVVAVNVVLAIAAFTLSGPAAAYCALSIGLFNAIQFPTIFSLTLTRANAPAPAVSGLLCVAIVGGAVMPTIAGRIADASDYGHAFIVPVIGYIGILIFALASWRFKGEGEHKLVLGGH